MSLPAAHGSRSRSLTLVVSMFGAFVMAGFAKAQLSFTDLGSTAPIPGQYDISQLLTTGDTAGYDGSGVNYYDNNSGSGSPRGICPNFYHGKQCYRVCCSSQTHRPCRSFGRIPTRAHHGFNSIVSRSDRHCHDNRGATREGFLMVINDDKTDGENPSSINEYWLSE